MTCLPVPNVRTPALFPQCKSGVRTLCIALLISALPTAGALADCPASPGGTDDLVVSFLQANTTQIAAASLFAATNKEGMLVYDDTDDALKICDGTSWIEVGGGGASSLATLSDVDLTGLSNGKVLTYNSTTSKWEAVAPSSAATPAGTVAGAVQFRGSTAVLAADDANLIWDDTNNRLGIGTATPAAALEVKSSGGTTGTTLVRLLTNDTWHTGLMLGNTSTNGHIWTLLAAGQSNTAPGTFQVYDNTAAAIRFQIDGGGNVGIGTTAPGSTLDVGGASNSAFIQNLAAWGLNARTQGVIIIPEGPVTDNGAGDLTIPTTIIMNPLSGSWVRVTAGTYSLGAWGSLWAPIPPTASRGTSVTPSVLAWVDSERTYDGRDRVLLAQRNGGGHIWTRFGLPANLSSATSLGGATPAGNDGSIQFKSGSNLAADAVNLHWDDTNKRLGIGTATPAYKLDVTGGFSTKGSSGSEFWSERPDSEFDMRMSSGSTKRGLSIHASPSGSSGNVLEVFGHNGTTFITGLGVTNAGNVGIGTTGPTARLQVNKELTSSDGTNGHLYLKVPAANDANAFSELAFGGRRSNSSHPIFLLRSKYNNNSTWADRSLDVIGQAYSGDAQATLLTIKDTGNVGIGTASPSYPLNVQMTASNLNRPIVARSGDDSNFYRLSHVWNNSATASGPFPGQSGGLYWEWGGGYGLSGGLVIGTNHANAGPLILSTAATERLRIDSGGNVGIGTTSPMARLHTRVATDQNLGFVQNGNGGDIGAFGIAAVNDANSAWVPLHLQASRFTLTQGNVGIGTASPAGSLDISASSPTVFLRSSATPTNYSFIASDANGALFVKSQTSDAYFGTQTGGMLLFQTNNDTKMVVTNAGNVGIGTGSPWAKLDVRSDTDTVIANGAYGASVAPHFIGFRARGTQTAPAQVLAGDALATFQGRPFINSSIWTGMTVVTTENFSNTAQGSAIFFATTPNGTVSTQERMRIDHNGNVGIGTTTPNQGKVEVMGGSVCVDTNSDGNATSCITAESDVRLKKKIEVIPHALATLGKLRGVLFDWRWDEYPAIADYKAIGRDAGVIAQEVEAAFPQGMGEELNGFKTVRYDRLVPLLIESVKELKADNDNLRAELKAANDNHAAKNEELRTEIEALKFPVRKVP